MKASHTVLFAFAAILGVTGSLPAFANADDVKWINQCVADNKDEGQTSKTVRVYCACMDNLMSSSETQSITQWEKTHKKEENLCGAKAGWVGK